MERGSPCRGGQAAPGCGTAELRESLQDALAHRESLQAALAHRVQFWELRGAGVGPFQPETGLSAKGGCNSI